MCGLLIGLGSPDLLLRGFRAPDVVAVAGVEGAGLIGVMVAPLCFTPPAVAVVLPVNLCVATIGATADLQTIHHWRSSFPIQGCPIDLEDDFYGDR